MKEKYFYMEKKTRVLLQVNSSLSKNGWGALALLLSKRFQNITCLKEGFSFYFENPLSHDEWSFLRELVSQMIVENITIKEQGEKES